MTVTVDLSPPQRRNAQLLQSTRTKGRKGDTYSTAVGVVVTVTAAGPMPLEYVKSGPANPTSLLCLLVIARAASVDTGVEVGAMQAHALEMREGLHSAGM